MNSEAQSVIIRGSVDNYVTRRITGWNKANRSCWF